MLLSCIKAEQMKLRRSFIWIAFFLLPLIPAVMGMKNYLNNLELLTSGWYSLWTQETLFYSNFFFGPMIAIYCAYLWRVENFHHNRNALMTAPVPISWIFRASRSASPDYPLLADPGTFRSSCGNRPAVSSFYGDPQLCPSHRPGCHRKHCGTAGLQHRFSLLLSLLFDDCGNECQSL